MCGRCTLEFDLEEVRTILKDVFKVKVANLDLYEPSYNISPSQQLVSIISDGKDRRAGSLKWGLVPSWAKDPKVGNSLINAREETINEKPSFKDSFESRRCIILVSGFYEWDQYSKQPYHITIKESSIMPLAGIWSTYKQGNQKLHTCAIVTTRAEYSMKRIHKRMPVIMDGDSFDLWLNIQTNQDTLKSIMKPYNGMLKMTPVSKIVNNVRNNTPECLENIYDEI